VWRRQLELALKVAKYSFMVFLVDRLPERTRRNILAPEYSGEMLEQRLTQRIFKGMPTIRALWRMSSINLFPRVAVGDPVPNTLVLSPTGRATAVVNLECLSQEGRPLVLNFGSCS